MYLLHPNTPYLKGQVTCFQSNKVESDTSPGLEWLHFRMDPVTPGLSTGNFYPKRSWLLETGIRVIADL